MPWSKGASNRRTARFLTGPLFHLLLSLLAFGQNPPAVAPPANQTPAPTQAPPPVRALVIMIDPAHGGSESGAALNQAIPEKDVTLAIAWRLREELLARGIRAVLLRNSDATLTTDQRAQMVNAAHPALYVAIHATSQGRGMRIYTAMLPASGDNSGPFVDWETAQSSALSRSRSVQDQVAAAIQRTGFPLRSLIAPLRPLNNVTVAALAVEIAPTSGNASQLASVDYQEMVTVALANSIAAIRGKLESAP